MPKMMTMNICATIIKATGVEKKKKKKETKRVSSVRKTLDLQLLKTNFYSVFFLFSRQYWRYKGFPGVHP